MGKRASEARRATIRTIRARPLTDAERAQLATASYEGSPLHKRNPGDFGLEPPCSPRLDKTLCDEAGIGRRAEAEAIFQLAVARGLVSESTAADGFPKQIWCVDGEGRVFEAMYGGSKRGAYHGYPIRPRDPLFERVQQAWQEPG